MVADDRDGFDDLQLCQELSYALDGAAYHRSAVQKTAYRLAEQCTVVIEPCTTSHLPLRFLFPKPLTRAEANERVRRFFQELTDQQLREQIAAETREIRAVLLAHAFSKTGLLKD